MPPLSDRQHDAFDTSMNTAKSATPMRAAIFN
jgi:hypothetical protein